MAFVSKHRGARISPKKARLVVDLVRGKAVDDAIVIMQMSKKRGAYYLKSVLESAKANAIDKGELSSTDARNLQVVDARIDAGPTIKRWRPKDRGRAHPIRKRTSHITVALDFSK